jgi:hypothetical protein
MVLLYNIIGLVIGQLIALDLLQVGVLIAYCFQARVAVIGAGGSIRIGNYGFTRIITNIFLYFFTFVCLFMLFYVKER